MEQARTRVCKFANQKSVLAGFEVADQQMGSTPAAVSPSPLISGYPPTYHLGAYSLVISENQ